MGHRAARASVAVLAAGALVAGCGAASSGAGSAAGHNSSSASPVDELTRSIHALGDARSLDLTLSLGASGADLLQIGAGLDHDGPTKAQADALTNDHISVQLQAPAGQTLGAVHSLSSAKGGAFAVTLGDATKDYFALETIDSALYARIDLPYFLGLAGEPGEYAAIKRRVGGLPPFVGAAVDGKWITLSAATLKSFAGLAQGLGGVKTPSASGVAGLRTRLLTTLLHDLTVTRVSSGSTDHLSVSAQLRAVITDEYAVIAPFARSLVPGDAGGLPSLRPADIPDVPVLLDAYVTNGALSKVVLDAGQFDTKEHISVPIELALSEPAPVITAPDGAVPVDFAAIGQLLSGAGV